MIFKGTKRFDFLFDIIFSQSKRAKSITWQLNKVLNQKMEIVININLAEFNFLYHIKHTQMHISLPTGCLNYGCLTYPTLPS